MGARRPVLVCQHDADADGGCLLPALRHSGLQVHELLTYQGDDPPDDIDAFCGLVSLGGRAFVSEASTYPFIAAEQRLFRQAVARDVPALGICLGAQILASALGAEVSSARSAQIGWDRVWVGASDDPIVGPLSPAAWLFEWHRDSFTLPPSATLLGSSDTVPVQAFRAGSAWGLQFHAEVERRHIEAWSVGAASESALRELGTSREELLAAVVVFLPEQQRLAGLMFDNFASLVRSHACARDASPRGQSRSLRSR
jgi:GMP synthase (glutamine-hydrolysing)